MAATMAGQDTADFLEYVAVVMDAGSAYTRAGFSGDESPRSVMRSGGGVSAYRRQDRGRIGSYRGNSIPNAPPNNPCTPGPMGEGSCLSRPINEGPSLVARRTTKEGLCPSRPISGGLVNDWAALEQLIGYVLEEELSVRPQDHAFLFTDYPLAPPTQRCHLAELLFETFEVPALHFGLQPQMALYAYGCVSGLLVDAGASGTRVCPVYEGYCLPHAARSSPVGGHAVIGYLKHLEERAGAGTKTEESQTKGDEEDELKRRGCYVAQDYETELHHHHHQGSEVTEYRLPDGSTVAVGDQHFRSGELLFRPALHGYSDPGAHILALSSLQSCHGNDLHNHLDNHILNDLDNDLLSDLQSAPECSLQRLLLGSVCVCGGVSLLPGFSERLQGELERLVPQGSAVQLLSARGRHYSAWLGGAVASCLSSFKPLWITSAQYREEGADTVLTRCY